MVTIQVDDKEIEAEEGMSLLQACLENEIYIPNLCYVDGMEHPPASCRMCFVEIEGNNAPVTSCTFKVTEGISLKTDTPEVRRLQRTALQLLLSVHDVDCAHCPANKKCELQRIAKFLKVGLKPKNLEQFLKEETIVRTHPLFDYYPNRCVLCGRCIYVSRMQKDKPFLTFAKRGFGTIVSFYGTEESHDLSREECLKCIEACPVGALRLKEES